MELITQIKGRKKQEKPKIRAEPETATIWQRYGKNIKIFLVFLVVGCALQVKELNQDKISKDNRLERSGAGEGETIEHLRLTIPELEEDTEYTVTVAERLLPEAERNALFARAEREIQESFCGENASVDCITTPVSLQKKAADGLVSISWRFDDYDVMNSDGTILQDALDPNGTVVLATAELTYGDFIELYEFPFCVYPRELTGKEKVYHELSAYFDAESKADGKDELVLPQEAGGFSLQWERKRSKTGILFIALGALAAVLLELSERQKEAERKKERDRMLMCDYPEIVNKLSLLLGAGMTVSGAWERILTLYEKQREEGIVKERPAYEEMRLTSREIKDGVGERKAYERFGERCGLRPYRKLSSLIVQNLRKGAKGLTALMAAEADEAFELRKNLAKKLGEEAGTKLLAPMLLMLGIIVVIIMVPAFLSFKT